MGRGVIRFDRRDATSNLWLKTSASVGDGGRGFGNQAWPDEAALPVGSCKSGRDAAPPDRSLLREESHLDTDLSPTSRVSPLQRQTNRGSPWLATTPNRRRPTPALQFQATNIRSR